MANIGDQLLQPEEGWQRIEDNDPKILYSGSTWQTSKDANYVTGTTMHYTGNESDAYIKFKFFGSKIRLISQVGKQFHPNDDSVIIDDIEYIINSYSLHDTYNSKVIEFEKLDLNNDIHNVIIKAGSNASHTLCLDAIDIDKDGYMITNLGCQLLQPEAGWQRIDNVDSKIVYDGNWTVESNISGNYNNTSYYGNAIGLMSSFKFKGTKLRIIGATNTDKSDKIEITIDDIKYTFSEYNSSLMRSILVFEKTELSDCIHTVTIKNVENKYIQLDCIDIDKDGYMVASLGCQLLQPEPTWKRIDDTDIKIKYSPGWSTNSDSSAFNSSYHYATNNDSTISFSFYGSKIRIIGIAGGGEEIFKINIDGIETQHTISKPNIVYRLLIFEDLSLENKLHNVTITKVGGTWLHLDAIDIDEDGQLLTEEEYESMLNKVLIKSDNKYYTIEDDNLVEITDAITSGLIQDRGVSTATLTEKQSLLPDKFKLISHRDNTFDIRAVKSHKELVVASSDFSTTVQSNIDFLDVVGITDTGTSIKVVFSIDGGVTWKTYDTKFKDLSVIIPSKPYNELTVEELNQWNNARDIISEQGIDIANLSKINFNTLNMEKIRFAYVLIINSKDDKCCTSQLKWQFDSRGTMKSMTSDELEIELLQDSIKIVPRVSSDMIKINFTNGSGSSNTEEDLTEDQAINFVNDIINE